MIFFYRIKYDYIKFSGKDRLDLLHRLSTNEVKSLGKFKGKKTILTTDKGRIVDLLTAYVFDDFVFTSCSFGNSASVIKHIDKYTITEDFRAQDLAGTHEAILFFGDKVNELIRDLFNTDPTGFSDNDFSVSLVEGKRTIVARNDNGLGGFILIYAVEDKEIIESQILESESFKKYEAAEIDDAKYEELRIEKGIPKLGKEIGEHVNPLECNLNQYVSFTKGCYIGQEVIARLDTYDKVSRHMVGVKWEEKFTNELLLKELRLTVDSKECGIITSDAESNKYGHIGLGFVKTVFLDYEKDYKIKNNEQAIDCKIIKLPFN